MFGKKSGKKKAPAQAQTESQTAETPGPFAGRIHASELGHVWSALTGMAPAHVVPQIAGTVLQEGGTRPAWQWKKGDHEYVLFAWPKDQPLRAAVLMGGKTGGQLKPLTVSPLLEGFANDLLVEDCHQRKEGGTGDVAAEMIEGANPMWFFDPLFGRDQTDLTPGVTHTFWLGAVALSLRKALLDEISLTSGPQFDEWARNWLAGHPGRPTHEVPPLKIDIRGKSIIMPGRVFGEYQIRARVEKIDDCQLDKMLVKALYLGFPFDNRPELKLPLYASKVILGEYDPRINDEIEAYIWLQGRIIDLERQGQP